MNCRTQKWHILGLVDSPRVFSKLDYSLSLYTIVPFPLPRQLLYSSQRFSPQQSCGSGSHRIHIKIQDPDPGYDLQYVGFKQF